MGGRDHLPPGSSPQHSSANFLRGGQELVLIKSCILQIRKAYKKLMLDTVKLLGGEGEDVERQLMEVYEFERKIADVS